jgi:hypothetical protein
MKSDMRIGLSGLLAVGLLSVACQEVHQPVAPIQAYSIGYETCETIDASGGTVTAGPYSVTLPAYALTQATEICITQTNSDQWPVELTPSPHEFAEPVTLSIDATGEEKPGDLSIYWWNPTLQKWEEQTTTHNGNVLSIQTSHFSRFTLG